jgi:serine/threonine-protein kinase
MGSVYEGENTAIARRVAIKVLHGDLKVHPQSLERFEREAQAAGRIGNDHILEVLDLGDLPSGDRFMVMEYLDGESLEDRLDRVTLMSGRETVPLVRQLLVGLGAAHDKGIIHRDLKPENVFVLKEKAGQTDFVKLIDFGISKFTAISDMRMTATGAVMGTPFYMSPEQAKGSKQIDVRSDLYAVGVILYRCVTGEVPFPGENFNEVLFNVVLGQARNPRDLAPGLEPGFETLIARAMAREPEERFQTASDFIAALDAWLLDGQVVSVPAPQRTSLAAGGPPPISGMALPSVPDGGTVAVDANGLPSPANSINGVTTGEWTQSDVRAMRSGGGKLWVLAAAFLGAGALLGGYFYLDQAPVTAQSAAPMLTEAADELSNAAEPRKETQEASREPPGPEPPRTEVTPAGTPAVAPSASADGEDGIESEPESAARPRKKRRRPPDAPRTTPKAPTPPAAQPPSPPRDELDFGY